MEALLLRQGIRVNQSQIMKIRVNHRVNQRFGGYFFALFPEKGGKRYGEDHDERAGISIPDGYQPSKGIQAGKDSGVPGHSCRQQDSDPRRSLQGMAAQNFCPAVEIITKYHRKEENGI